MTRHLRETLALILATLVVAGCSGGGGGGGGASASTAAPTTSASTTSPTNSALPGTTTATPPATSGGPVITVTSPVRGSFATQASTVVEGSIADTVGIVSCAINGSPVALGTGATFNEPITLTEGLNVIIVSATDTSGTTNETSLGVIYGQYQPADQTVAGALAVRLNQGVFTAAQTIAATQLTGAKLSALVLSQTPLATLSVAGSNLTITATSATFGNPTLTLTPNQGYLDVHVVVPQIALSINETSSGGSFPSMTANPTADSATVDAQVAISVNAGVVTISVINDTATLTNFQLNGGGLVGTLLGGSLGGVIQTQIQSMVKQQLPAEINKLIAGATGAPITQTILGTTATFTFVPASITIDPQGVSAVAGANCAVAPVGSATPFNAPGSLVTSGAAPAHGGPSPDFFASINQDLVNRISYEVWQAGLMQVTIDGSASSPIQPPASIVLDMGTLETLLPDLQGKAATTDAIALVIAPQLPPIFSPAAAPANLQASIGELQIQILDTTTNQSVLTFVVQATVLGNASLNAQNTFDITFTQQPTINVTLVSSPLAPALNSNGVQNLVAFVVPPLIQSLGSLWQGFQIPLYPGLNLNSVSIAQDGANGNFLTVSGDVH